MKAALLIYVTRGRVEIIGDKVHGLAASSGRLMESPSGESSRDPTIPKAGMYVDLEDFPVTEYRPIVVGRPMEPLQEEKPNRPSPLASNEEDPLPEVPRELF